MNQLFGLLYKARNVFLFLFLEIISFALLKENNIRWNVSVFNSTNLISGNILTKTSNLKEYLKLKEVNLALAKENEYLNNQVGNIAQLEKVKSFSKSDSIYAARFNYTMAKVISNSINFRDNYFTINKGENDGLSAGMGVIGPYGIVGQLKACSSNFCVGYSILHSRFNVSSEVRNDTISKQNEAALGIGSWLGEDPYHIKLSTILRYKPVFLGDTITTSEQNSIFPSGIMVGTISKLGVESNKAFHDIEVKLSTDFSNLVYVYIIKNNLLEEQQKLESESIPKKL